MSGHRRPAVRLILDGIDLTDRVAPLLESLNLREKRGDEADQLDLTINDVAGKVAIPKKGAVIALELGWEGEALTAKGTFKVDETEHEGPPDMIRVTARAADFTAELRTRREQSWRNTTLGVVLAAIAGRQGLRLSCSADLKATPIAVIAQSRESDAAFLARLGKRYDAVATVKAGALVFIRKGSGKTASGKTLPAATLTRSDGDRHRWRGASRDSDYTGVSASWHSTGSARRHRVQAGKDGKVKRLKKVFASEAAALEACRAELGRIGRSGGELTLNLAFGRPDIYPECPVTVAGFKPEIDGAAWLVDEISHSYVAGGGLTSSMTLEVS